MNMTYSTLCEDMSFSSLPITETALRIVGLLKIQSNTSCVEGFAKRRNDVV